MIEDGLAPGSMLELGFLNLFFVENLEVVHFQVTYHLLFGQVLQIYVLPGLVDLCHNPV